MPRGRRVRVLGGHNLLCGAEESSAGERVGERERKHEGERERRRGGGRKMERRDGSQGWQSSRMARRGMPSLTVLEIGARPSDHQPSTSWNHGPSRYMTVPKVRIAPPTAPWIWSSSGRLCHIVGICVGNR